MIEGTICGLWREESMMFVRCQSTPRCRRWGQGGQSGFSVQVWPCLGQVSWRWCHQKLGRGEGASVQTAWFFPDWSKKGLFLRSFPVGTSIAGGVNITGFPRPLMWFWHWMMKLSGNVFMDVPCRLLAPSFCLAQEASRGGPPACSVPIRPGGSGISKETSTHILSLPWKRVVKIPRQLVNKQVKGCSTSLIMQEMQNKTSMRYHLGFIRVTITNKQKII